jgi:hypothetical protein
MDPEYIGALAESVGAAAVVVSLLYVARQVRQGGQQARLMTVHTVTAQFHSIMQLTASNAGSARVWGIGLLEGMSSLEKDEALQFGQLLGLLMSSYENVFRYYQEGLIDRDRLREIERPYVAVMACPGFADYWRIWGPIMAVDFQRHVDTKMREAVSSVDVSRFETLQAEADDSGRDSTTGTT